ncbi:MAG: hypothetical protein MZV64_72740 [Ignavibacteriales bacterium]|nr:hypothetical protein [Ignavibacteriales bacterium]
MRPAGLRNVARGEMSGAPGRSGILVRLGSGARPATGCRRPPAAPLPRR